MQLKRYSSKEPMILVWFLCPYILFINLLLFGSCFFNSFGPFIIRFGISALYYAIIYGVFGIVAVVIKKRFPEDSQLFRRIYIMLPLFYIMNYLTVQGIYIVYERINFTSCNVQRSMEWWVTGFGCIASTFLTFINEAAAGWEKWKTSVTETGRLQNTYQRSRLLGLKQQINPHFLFNCFNSLSSLINEDEAKAERFLDEMTKVHRYMLRGDEQFVQLAEELKFAQSYLYLTKARFGEAIRLNINVQDKDLQKKIPPLSLQVILENIIYSNAADKNNPLQINIYSGINDRLVIENTIHPKANKNNTDYEEGVDNLIDKYKLLNQAPVEVQETGVCRKVLLPLIIKEEVAT